MGTAQTLADEHAGLPEIGAKSCATGHFVLAIRPDGTLADPLVVRADRMQELCVADGVQVGIQGDARNTSHWRRRGEDVNAGSEVLPAGRCLRTQDVALAGALGCKELAVFKRLRVGLFATGDDLCEPVEALGSGQIWNAN
jgi:molybdopterin biosynthesis enzyme